MLVKLTREEIKKAYHQNCPLETALKRLYPNSNISIPQAAHPQTNGVVKIDNTVFTYNYTDWNYILHQKLKKTGNLHVVNLHQRIRM